MDEATIQNESLKRRMELRRRVLAEQEVERVNKISLRLPRKMGQWLGDKLLGIGDYSPYDFEGRPEPRE